jgi:chromosome partitioning protein
MVKVLVLGGSKGGTGRSTTSRNLLVAARQGGINAVGVDLDAQRTFGKWADRRVKARETFEQIVDAKVLSASIDGWDDIRGRVTPYDLAIVDTAPGVEHAMPGMAVICREAAYVLVPTSPSTDDLESVIPWWRALAANGSHGCFVLNKANRRTKSFAAARSMLLRHGALAPVEIPQLEDIAAPFASGLAVVDYDNARGAEAMHDLWRYVARELAL